MKVPSLAALITLVLVGCSGDKEPASDPAKSVVATWVEALNSRDFARACELSVLPKNAPCERLLSATFKGYEGDVAIESSYADAREGEQAPLVFSLTEGPDGFSAGQLERVDGNLRVHWETQITS